MVSERFVSEAHENPAPLSTDVVWSEKNIVSTPSSSERVSSASIVQSSKKILNYLFTLDVTRKKLEGIEKKIKKLVLASESLLSDIEDKKQELLVLKTQYSDILLDYNTSIFMFKSNLALCGIDDPNIIINAEKQEAYFAVYEQELMGFFSAENNKRAKSEKQSKQELATIVKQEIDNKKKQLEELFQENLNAWVKQQIMEFQESKITTKENELLLLNDKFIQNQNTQEKLLKKIETITADGILASCEFSGDSLSLADFVGRPETLAELQQLVSMYTHKEQFSSFGISLPKGVLFYGDKETGKTFAAKVLASEINRKMYHIRAHDLFSEDITDPNEMLFYILSLIIDRVQKHKESCIVFLDEIEKIIDSVGEYNPVAQKIISNTLIKNIVNIQKSDLDIIIVAALWNKHNIESTFMKYNLFDVQISFELPEKNEIQKLFEQYIKEGEKKSTRSMFALSDYDKITQKLKWFSPSYIKQLVSLSQRLFVNECVIKNSPNFKITEQVILDIHKSLQEKRGTKYYWQPIS